MTANQAAHTEARDPDQERTSATTPTEDWAPRIMNNGFVPVATISPQIRVADPEYNGELCFEQLQRAYAQGAKVVAFPEVTLTSYIADDMLYHDILLEGAMRALAKLVARTADMDVVFSIGIPLCINGKIYNTVAVCHAGRILGVVPKTFIPTYGVDFEGRWFNSGPKDVTEISLCGQDHVPFGSHQVFRCRQMPMLCLGYEICEDIWAPNSPSIELALAGATIICNGSASNASLEKGLYRHGLISGQSARLLCCYAYCSSGQGDSTGDVTVGGQEIIAENGSVLAEAYPFGEGYAIADVDVESLWGARRGMSSFHVAPTPQAAGYHETLFDMDIPEHDLIRPVSPTPFVPADPRDRDACCDLAVKMQSHGLLARVVNQDATHVAIDTTDANVQDVALAIVAASALTQMEGVASPDVYVCTDGDTGEHRTQVMRKLADALGLPVATLAEETKLPASEEIDEKPLDPTISLASIVNDSSWVLVNPCDMTQLALGLVEFPFDIGRQYGINSQIVHTIVPVVLQRVADTWPQEGLKEILEHIINHPDILHTPEHDAAAANFGFNIGPTIVQDFYLDGFLRAQYRPAKLFALARQAFAGKYGDRQLLLWMRSFYERFFNSQFMRHALPDGPRIGSAGLDLRDGFMMPTYAQGTLWLDEVDQLLAKLD
ncbi:MAG: nitrilase-related carbon-nitrogen hydrolase [Bifidobacterium sp.]|nr:nitrilase-related carbon-nitrogen hydrolase [Bifidobacterium sp.]